METITTRARLLWSSERVLMKERLRLLGHHWGSVQHGVGQGRTGMAQGGTRCSVATRRCHLDKLWVIEGRDESSNMTLGSEGSHTGVEEGSHQAGNAENQ